MLWADAIVFGSPVYMGTMTAQLKAVFDRARPLWIMENALSHKVAAAVAVGAAVVRFWFVGSVVWVATGTELEPSVVDNSLVQADSTSMRKPRMVS